MFHKPIQIQDLCLSLPHKTCFEGFNAIIPFGSRITLIGQNGCGKTTLLKILQKIEEPTEGIVCLPDDLKIGYVPQLTEDFKDLSGGQQFNKALTQALQLIPDLLMLDEPTNHLDLRNRYALLRMLKAYQGTLIIASHDVELIQECTDILWHIDQGKIFIFHGNYNDYRREIQFKRSAIELELSVLNRQKKVTHQALMKEQERAKKSDQKGEKSIQNRKWPTIVSDEKARKAIETSGNKKKMIRNKRENLNEQLSQLRLPEILTPKFSLNGNNKGKGILVSVKDGTIGYLSDSPILTKIYLSVEVGEHTAVVGNNGSGKSTLVKAVLDDMNVNKKGEWEVPSLSEIGYLDQHYANLSLNQSVLENVQNVVPNWSPIELRQHLNDFLFRKNEEVNCFAKNLSGGEKARLSLALIAAKTPKLLILDEITNNLDLETKEHVVQVLKAYPGTMIVISHDENFLKEIPVNQYYFVKETSLNKV